MNADVWERFQLGTTTERLAFIANPQSRETLRSLLGDVAVEGYLRLASVVPRSAHLGEDHTPNLVFVPGVMGSYLASLGLGGIWWLDLRNLRRLDDLGLDRAGTGDATAGARIAPVAVDSTYDTFCAAVLARDDFGHKLFWYDWRRPIPAVVDGLRDLVDDCFAGNGGRPVHLVAHSMGGLVVREALRRYSQLWDRVGRVVFLGTPHYGSPAIAGYLKGHLWGFELLALLGLYLSRATFRSLWGVLDLLPAPAGIYPNSVASPPASHPCAGFDLYSVDDYHLRNLDAAERVRLQNALDAAAGFHRDLAGWRRGLDQEFRDRMLVVAGVGFKTLFRLEYGKRLGFLWEHMDRVVTREPGNMHREGDGRVPLASAQLEYVGATRYVRAEHGSLPSVGLVQDAVFDWLLHQSPDLPSTPAAALAATLSDDVDPAVPELAAPTGTRDSEDDPGYLDLTPPDEAALARRAAAVKAGEVPEFARLRIL